MTRSSILLCVAFASATFAQTTCPTINFNGPQTINLRPEPASHLDLMRQADGSWTAFTINDADPGFVVAATPHFEKQIVSCLPPGQLKSGPAPVAVPPANIIEVTGVAGSTISYTILNSQHTVISSGAVHLNIAPGATITSAGVSEITGDGILDVLAFVQGRLCV